MKPRSLVATVIAAALVGGAVWYFTQPAAPAPAPVKTAEAPKAAAAAPVKPSTQIAPPIAPPVVAPAPKPTAAQPAANPDPAAAKTDPQAELNTAIDDIISLLQSGNMMALFEKYATPEDQAKMPPEEKAQMEQMMSQPGAQMMIQMMVSGIQSIKDQTPQMNAAGDEATYQMTMSPPAGMGPAGRAPQTEPMTFVKVDGKWYIKDGI